MASRIDRLERGELTLDVEQRDKDMLAVQPCAVRPDALGHQIRVRRIGRVCTAPAEQHLFRSEFTAFGLLRLKPGLPGAKLQNPRFGQDWKIAARQSFGGRANIQPFLGMEKVKDVAVSPAAETMVPLLIRIDRE